MPPTFPIASLNRYTPNFSGVPQKLTWCQQFGLQIFPKWGDADIWPQKNAVFRCFFGLNKFSRPNGPVRRRYRETLIWHLNKVFLNCPLKIQSLCKRGRTSLWTLWQHSNIWARLFLTGEYIHLMMKASGQIYTKFSVGRWHGQDPYWGHWT